MLWWPERDSYILPVSADQQSTVHGRVMRGEYTPPNHTLPSFSSYSLSSFLNSKNNILLAPFSLSFYLSLLLCILTKREAEMFNGERDCTVSFCMCVSVRSVWKPPLVKHILSGSLSRSPLQRGAEIPRMLPGPAAPSWFTDPALSLDPGSPAEEERGWVCSPTPAPSPGSPTVSASPLPSTPHTHLLAHTHSHTLWQCCCYGCCCAPWLPSPLTARSHTTSPLCAF